MTINKTIIAVFTFLLCMSCSDGDMIVDQVLEETGSGGVLRTISTNNATLNYDNPAEAWSITVEAQDEEDGDLLELVEVHAGLYRDAALVDTEQLIKEIPASAFAPGPYDLPRTDIEVSLEELMTSLNLSQEEYFRTDEFRIRLVYVMTNGQTWTNTDASGTVLTSTFYVSPYLYTVPFSE